MLTNRCVCCDNILKEHETKFNKDINDYNDMCGYCVKMSKDTKHINDYNFSTPKIEMVDGNDGH